MKTTQAHLRLLAAATGLLVLLVAAVGPLWGQTPAAAVQMATAVHYVSSDGNCNGATPCYSTVQSAVDAATAGDEIRVAAGTYTGVTNIPLLNSSSFTATQLVAITKTITLRGGFTPTDWDTSDPVANETILDAQQQGRVMAILGEVSPVVSGFTLRNGSATNLGGKVQYPGICEPPNFPTDVGGGLYIARANALIENNKITNNIASISRWSGGGGIMLNCSSATISRNTIELNTANGLVSSVADNAKGGGIMALGPGGFSTAVIAPTISHNTIQFNVAGGNGADGGGIYVGENIQATITGNFIWQNDTTLSAINANGSGGGIYVQNGHEQPVFISGNTIIANRTGSSFLGFGGGIYIYNTANFTVYNNMIGNNSAGAAGAGMMVWGFQGQQMDGYLLHNTIAANFGVGSDGLFVEGTSFVGTDTDVGTLTLINNIFASNTRAIKTYTAPGLSMTILDDHSLWDNSGTYHENTGGATVMQTTNQVIGNPGLVGFGDFHLTAVSDAIDAGVNTGLVRDIDDHLRPIGQGVDIGADEIGTAVAVPAAGGVIDATNALGIGPIVTIPAGAVSQETTFTLTPLAGVDQLPAGLSYAGQAFDLSAAQGGTPLGSLSFTTPVTAVIRYRDEDIRNIAEDSLTPLYLEGTSWSANGLTVVARDPANNTVTFTTTHLSEFALFGETFQVYLPVIVR